MSRRTFAAAVVAGMLLRAAALALPGTNDVAVWKIWAYQATLHAAAGLYGVGGSPPERRVLDFHGATTTVDYPPLALYELGLVGRAYRAAMHRRFPDSAILTAAIKGAAVAAEAVLVCLIFLVVRRTASEESARWAVAANWLNPASIMDASVLGYLDPLFVLPAAGALVAAAWLRPGIAGGLIAAAILTKAQAIVIVPAVVLLVWNAGPRSGGVARLLFAAGGGLAVAGAVLAPIVAAGAWPNMLNSLQALTRHDMLSANACNLWWIVGYVLRVWYSMGDMGVWAALTAPAKILQISRVLELGYPNPRVIGAALTLGATLWALWTARAARGVWMASAIAAFLVHVYATLGAQVHENHLFAAVPLLAIAAAGRPRYRPLFIAVSLVFAMNLNLFYGISENVGYAMPRTLTFIDLTVILALVNCAALGWHAAVLRSECSTAAAPLRSPAPA